MKPIFQPPDWVFGVIWPIITLTLGAVTNSFLKSRFIKTNQKNNILTFYFLIIASFVFWLYLNNSNFIRESFYLLIFTTYLSIVFLIYLANVNDNNLKNLIWLLLPMPFWLVLASCLNGVLYNNKLN